MELPFGKEIFVSLQISSSVTQRTLNQVQILNVLLFHFFFFMKEHLRMCMCTCLLEDLAQYRLSLEKKPLLTPKIMKTRNED